MAITRRQFVTRLGALAAAAGFSQFAGIADHGSACVQWHRWQPYQGVFGKPRVVWIHGAECTGCSTSLLGIFENQIGEAIPGSGITTAAALGLAGTLPTNQAPVSTAGGLLLHDTGVTALVGEPADSINIADVVIDVIDLIYHETVMGMGGDLAYQWLKNFEANNAAPFVLVVEGALQNKHNGGAWGDDSAASKAVPWCSIGMDGTVNTTGSLPRSTCPRSPRPSLRARYCGAVIGIGQCATFGGYPGCKPPITTASAHFDTGKSQTDALGIVRLPRRSTRTPTWPARSSTFLVARRTPGGSFCRLSASLVDIPSILSAPVNTVGTLGVLKKVAANANNALGIGVNVGGGVDVNRRIKAVYGNPIHGPYCPRYRNYTKGVYATQPGDPGCLQKIGCKGPAAKSLCGLHGWNNQQPTEPGWLGRWRFARQPRSQRHDVHRRPLHSCWPPVHGVHREGLS